VIVVISYRVMVSLSLINARNYANLVQCKWNENSACSCASCSPREFKFRTHFYLPIKANLNVLNREGGIRFPRLSQLACWFILISVTKSDNSRLLCSWAKSWWFYLIYFCSCETLWKLMWIWLDDDWTRWSKWLNQHLSRI